jgi:hypothetical protein
MKSDLKGEVFVSRLCSYFAHHYLAADENFLFTLLLTSLALPKRAEWKTNVEDCFMRYHVSILFTDRYGILDQKT